MMRREEVLTRFCEVQPTCNSLEEAAERIGMSLAGLEKALERARAAGDRRGVYQPMHIRTPRNRQARRQAILAGWEALPSPKPSYAVAAKRIGCTRAALATTLSRARRDGVEVSAAIDIDIVLEDWVDLRDRADEHWERAAGRLGLTPSVLSAILREARRAGDPRGALTTEEARCSTR